MGLVRIQLSDLHLSCEKTSNPVQQRTDLLGGSIRSVLQHDDCCVLVCSGDIADKGKEEEYDLAVDFIDTMYRTIQDHVRLQPQLIIVPGNHDLDFEIEDCDESIRNMILEQCTPTNPPNSAMHEYCLKPQRPFREFVERLGGKVPISAVQDLMDLKVLSFDSFSVQFLLLNTTRFTRKKEVPASTWFPAEDLDDYVKKHHQPGIVSIGVLHHPYNWHHPDNARQLRVVLEAHCDILLTGHEHYPDNFKKSRRSPEQNLYVEGGVLQDHDDSDNSSYNVVRIDSSAKTFVCCSFGWNENKYEQVTEDCEHKYLRLRQPLLSEFELRDDWIQWLDIVGTDFRHPRRRDPLLSDFFVYPDLQRLDLHKACSPRGTVRDGDLLGFIQEKKRTVIAGVEKTGKTSLAKRLFVDLREAGFVPLLVRSDFRIDKSSKDSAITRIIKGFETSAKRIYSPDAATRFWQTKIAERALIIDDYDRLSLRGGGREELLRWSDENFGLVVLLCDPGIRMTEILNRPENDTLLWTFEHVDILECDAESRDALIRNWLLCGTDPYEVSTDDIYREKVRYAQVIDSIIGQGAIPSLPLFILMMMQQLETRGNVDNSTGLYGYLYEFLIRDIIKGTSNDVADLEVKLNYLSEFAFALHSRSRRFMEDADFVAWHSAYCSTFHCDLNGEQMLHQLRKLGVFRKDVPDVGFKYRYYYCFFLARYLANNIHEESIIKEVEKLCQILHIADAANTMLFLCHLSRDPIILDLILGSVKSLFPDSPRYDLARSTSNLAAQPICSQRLVLASEEPEQERERALRVRDQLSRPCGLDEITDDTDDRADEEELTVINDATSALHAIRIGGQLIRNFYGWMRGNVQVEVLRECYDLCLRMLSCFYQILGKNREAMTELMGMIVRRRYPKLSSEEADEKVTRVLQMIEMAIGYGLIKHTSNSVGLAALKMSFDQVMLTEGIGLSHGILDISVRLDYFDGFPESKVMDVAAAFNEGSIGHQVLRILVFEHFKMFRCDYRVRQRVCTKLHIEANQPAFMISPGKKRLT